MANGTGDAAMGLPLKLLWWALAIAVTLAAWGGTNFAETLTKRIDTVTAHEETHDALPGHPGTMAEIGVIKNEVSHINEQLKEVREAQRDIGVDVRKILDQQLLMQQLAQQRRELYQQQLQQQQSPPPPPPRK